MLLLALLRNYPPFLGWRRGRSPLINGSARLWSVVKLRPSIFVPILRQPLSVSSAISSSSFLLLPPMLREIVHMGGNAEPYDSLTTRFVIYCKIIVLADVLKLGGILFLFLMRTVLSRLTLGICRTNRHSYTPALIVSTTWTRQLGIWTYPPTKCH